MNEAQTTAALKTVKYPGYSPDIVSFGLVKCIVARVKGLHRMGGKEYVVQDGDVMLFKFNV